MQKVSRRTLLLSGAASLAAVTLGTGAAPAFRHDRTDVLASARAVYTAGTTLEQTAAPGSATGGPAGGPHLGYRRLLAGPGYPLVVREELCAAVSGRDGRRTAIASLVQLTDLHIVDAQSPMRFEYLAQGRGALFRPHEALGTHGAAQLVERINALGSGPFSGRAFDCVVSTGDSTDNGETIELDWYLALLSGGTIEANTGAPRSWEGVQTTGDELFYNPQQDVRDRYQATGFPRLDGYFARAIAPHVSAGLNTPWYAVFGNHDDSIVGSVPSSWLPLEELYTGSTKFVGFRSDAANRAIVDAFTSGIASRSGSRLGSSIGDRPAVDTRWQVTPDERRAPFSATGFMRAHLADQASGPGPLGHGFTAEAVEEGRSYYSWPLADGVIGISLDSTNRAGFAHGSIGEQQLAWLDRLLTEHGDHYAIVFSHHTSGSMDNLLPDPTMPDESRHGGEEVLATLASHPNVLAWVNGHTHSNRITPHHGASARHSFWEINTASHIEFPQQARIVDVCRNGDGTISLFTTLIESAAPYQASYSDGGQAALASLYREFSYNDLSYTASHAGEAADRNTELLLSDPLA